MALVQLALPGAVYLYNGDELGLPDADLPDEARRDAVWHHGEDGRDGCRVPQPWEADLPGVRVHHRRALAADPRRLRRAAAPPRSSRTPAPRCRCTGAPWSCAALHPGFAGAPPPGPALEWFGAPPGCLAFRRTGTTLVCALNTSRTPVPLPPGDALLVSGPLDDGMLPPDTAVWLA